MKKAEKKLADLKYEIEHGIYARQSDITLNEWFETWMRDFKEKVVKSGTQEVYRNMYNSCIKKSLGKRALKDIRLEHIQRLYNNMADSYAEGTIRLVGVILQGLFRQAMKAELISRNPVQLATIPRARERQEKKVLTVEEQNIFLKYAKEYSRLYLLFVFALLTGCRNGEVRGLEWKDIDFEYKTIHITGTLKYVKSIGTYKGSPKSKTSKRDIPMLDACFRVLKQQEQEQKENIEIAGSLWKPIEGLEDLVFTQTDGRPLGRESLSAELEKLLRKMRSDGHPIEDFTFHSLRHTFATRGVENGISMKTMQVILGHAQYSMTADLYSHVLPSTKAEEMGKIAHLFENST